jgi:hypothetical protein
VKLARPATLLISVLAGTGLLSAGCPNSSHAEVFAPARVSPVATVEAWFQAINERNLKGALAVVEPKKKGMMDWGGGTSQWTTFSAVHCRTDDQKVNFSEVYCSFTQSPPSVAGPPVTFWTVAMRRRTSGPWLISSYGQG